MTQQLSLHPADRRRASAAALVDEEASPTRTSDQAKQMFALLLVLAITSVAVAEYCGLIPVAWLAVGPLLGSLALSPWITAVLAGWSVLLGLGLTMGAPHPTGGLASHLGDMALLAAFAVANAVILTALQRRLGQVRDVARAAQSALLPEVPASVNAGRLASRYVSAAAEARVGGDLLAVSPDERHPRWLIGDTRGHGLPAVRLASVAMTSFRDACAQPSLSLPEIARVVDRSVTCAAGDEDFVTAVFAELDPRGWLQLVICGHPSPLRLTTDGDLQALTPRSYATPLGLHPDIQPSTFTVSAGDRLVFYTDGLLEARDQSGCYFRLEDWVGTLRQPDLQTAADQLLSQVLAHTGRKLDDDATLLLLEVTSPLQDEPDCHTVVRTAAGLAGPPPPGTRWQTEIRAIQGSDRNANEHLPQLRKVHHQARTVAGAGKVARPQVMDDE